MSNIPLKFLYGDSSQKLLNSETVSVSPGTVYFSGDGKIIFDTPDHKRILMEASDILECIPTQTFTIPKENWLSIMNGTEIHGYEQQNQWGTFAIQIILELENKNPVCYSGIFSNYMGEVMFESNDEILLHRSGVNSDNELYARLSQTLQGTYLQIKAASPITINNTDLTNPQLKIRIRRLL